MQGYKPEWEEPIAVPLTNSHLTIYSVPPPGSGAVLASIINIMENFDIIEDDPIFYKLRRPEAKQELFLRQLDNNQMFWIL